VQPRVRIRYRKEGDLVFLSHHDLMRLWERALRRSGLPLAFTEGFHPRPRVSHPLALGLGVSSTDEIVEVGFSRWVTAAQIQEELGKQLPEGIFMIDLEMLAPGERGQVEAIGFEWTVPEVHRPAIERGIASFREGEAVTVRRARNGRLIDIRSWVREIALEGDRLRFSFHVNEHGTGRPEEMLEALGVRLLLAAAGVRKVRTDLKKTVYPARPRRSGRAVARARFPRSSRNAGKG
jgi:radical SAM-linked protein